MSKKKVQLSTRWPRPLYDLAVTVANIQRRSVGWILIEWALKGAQIDGHSINNSQVTPDDEVEDAR